MDKLEDFSVVTEDGIALPATHFSGAGDGPVVVISSAVAVPRKIYRHFAQHLLDKGASHVYTYDFRGIGGQKLARSKLKSIDMMDWAVKDFPAVVDYVRKAHPCCELVGVGHSFGGQVLGMGEKHKLFTRYLGIACGSGYIKYTKRPCSLSLRMRVAKLACPVVQHKNSRGPEPGHRVSNRCLPPMATLVQLAHLHDV